MWRGGSDRAWRLGALPGVEAADPPPPKVHGSGGGFVGGIGAVGAVTPRGRHDGSREARVHAMEA